MQPWEGWEGGGRASHLGKLTPELGMWAVSDPNLGMLEGTWWGVSNEVSGVQDRIS